MNRLLIGFFLFILLFANGCAVSQSREATALQNAEANRPPTYRRFARPRPFIGFPYPVGVVGGIGGVGVGGVCP
jgi:hypothetical protein